MGTAVNGLQRRNFAVKSVLVGRTSDRRDLRVPAARAACSQLLQRRDNPVGQVVVEHVCRWRDGTWMLGMQAGNGTCTRTACSPACAHSRGNTPAHVLKAHAPPPAPTRSRRARPPCHPSS